MRDDERRHTFTAVPAHRGNIFLRMGLCGAGGSGKSYSALAIASALQKRLNCGPLFVIDSENKSALRYARSSKSGRGFDFLHVEMPIDNYSPRIYGEALDFCERQGAGVILVDSISHEYDGPGGILEMVDNNANGRDNFAGWRVATPHHKRFLQRLNSVQAHIIWTVRAKMAYEMRPDPTKGGKMTFQKVGLGPVQREGIEYEPDIFGWMADATLTIDKTRCDRIEPQSQWVRPGDDVAALLADWVQDTGAEPAKGAEMLHGETPAPVRPQSSPLSDLPTWAAPIHAARAKLGGIVSAAVKAAVDGAADPEHAERVLQELRKVARSVPYPEDSIGKAVVDWRKRVAEATAQPATQGAEEVPA